MSGTVNANGENASGAGRPGVLWLSTFVAALVLYVATLAPDLVWQDSGEYQWTSARLSWPPAVHQADSLTHYSVWCRPGEAVRVHPWFVVTAWLVGRVPFWNYAYAANLCSAISMALAAANVVLLVRWMTGRTAAAVVAGIAFAVGHTVWTFAVISEVLGWSAALASAEGLCAWMWLRQREERWLLLLFFLNGVALSNHLMAALSLAVFGVWMVVECVRRRAPGWVIPAAAGVWLLGGMLYWVVVGLEYARTGDLVETLRSATVGYHTGAVANVGGLGAMLGRSALYLALNYPTPLAAAGVVGLVVLVRRRDAFSVLLVALGAVTLAWAARYRVPDQYSFFVPFYVWASVAIGVGAARVLDGRRWARWPMLALALLPVAVYAVLPEAVRQADPDLAKDLFKRQLPYRDSYRYFLQPWKCGDRSARRFAEEALEGLPKRAVLLADTTPSPPLKCLRDVEGVRRDVLVVDPYDSRFSAGLRVYWPGRSASGAPPPPPALAEGRRAFVVSDVPGYVPQWVGAAGRLEPFGRIFEFKPAPEGEGP